MRTQLFTLSGVCAVLVACGGTDPAGSKGNPNPNDPNQGNAGTSGSGGSTSAGGTEASSGAGPSSGGSTTQTTGGSGASTSGGDDAGGSGGGNPGPLTAEGCPDTQEPGTWLNVTAPGMKMDGDFVNGPITIGVDPAKPSDVYVHVQHDGTWKSTDCGFTWEKVSTGQNTEAQDTGSQWGAVIDPNPNRDPSTPPTLFVNQGYGANSLWKSVDGGVNWTNAWDNNIFNAEGENISGDVGNDMAGVQLLSSDSTDHLLEFLHSYWGDGGNNGVFESTDNGATWSLHPTPGFNFQPHSDLLSAADENTWWVCSGYPAKFYRSTDGGDSWEESAGDAAQGMGHSIAHAGGDIYYTGSDFHDGVLRTTDKGASWTRLDGVGNQVSWVATTATKVYASNGYTVAPHIFVADLDNDTAWTDLGNPESMVENGANNPGVLFDGEHYVILAVQARGGVQRYVEPVE